MWDRAPYRTSPAHFCLLVLLPILLLSSTRALGQEDSPEAFPASYRLARHLSHTGDLPGALRLYDQLLESQPENLELEIERARVLAWMGRLDESTASMEAVTKRAPTAVDAWAVLADAQLWNGDLSGARDALAEGLQSVPDPVPLLLRLARLDYRTGDVGAARESMSHALLLDPSLDGGQDALALYSPWVIHALALVEDGPPGAPWTTLAIDASLRPRGPWSVMLGVERTQRFAREEHTFRAGVARAAGQLLLVSAGIQIAPEAETVPRQGGFIQLDWNARPRWRLGTMARVIRFGTGSATILRSSITRVLGGDWEATYDLSWARDVAGNHDFVHVGRLLCPLSYRSSAQFEIVRGIDVERVGTSLDSRTVSETGVTASLRFYLARSWGVRARAGYIDRERTYRSRTLGLGIIRHL